MARYSVGIDLGTTNCAVSYLDLMAEKSRGAEQSVLAIPQVTALGTVEDRPLLPSFLYIPAAGEFPTGAISVPGGEAADVVVGHFARSHGAKVPMRLVSSAKSWLCHAGVDRQSAILPWQAPADVHKISPLDASAQYLRHLRTAWERTMPDEPLAQQDVILTVPASFDAAARELTLRAAQAAGLPGVTLLEEPQAAFYAWIEQRGEAFRQQVKPGDVVLVIDVGGGTSDFSLIAVTDRAGEVELTRLAVGDHILLGGDNMDLALAFAVSQGLATQGRKLDSWQFNALTYACREAKERMLQDASLERAPLVIPGRGSSLIGGSIKAELSRDELTRVLLEGFFPENAVTDLPQSARRTGLANLALPYAQDAGITRHLGAFLTRQARALASAHDVPVQLDPTRTFVHPTVVLFNGGVFKPTAMRQRVLDILNRWVTAEGGAPVKELNGAELDLAVAQGAAYYGWVRQGHGLRIRGGTARAYYVGVEAAMPAVPGIEPPVRALCVAPFGMEEGTQAEIPPQEFGLVVGEPTQFRFFSSSVRREDPVGAMIDDPVGGEDFEEVAPIETTLPAGEGAAGGMVPVNLQAAVTELGTLELRCIEKGTTNQWKLELNVRMKE